MVRVGVCEENEILRLGLIASLAQDQNLHVIPVSDLDNLDIEIAIVSIEAAKAKHFRCPIIVCAAGRNLQPSVANGNKVVGWLNRRTLTGAQLCATVHAAVTGLVVFGQPPDGSQPKLEPRPKQVLEMIAEGLTTHEIAKRMGYSERTIKKLISGLQSQLHARNRAQIVAQAIKRDLI